MESCFEDAIARPDQPEVRPAGCFKSRLVNIIKLYSARHREQVASVTLIAQTPSITGLPCAVSISTCRSLLTIASGL